MAAAGRPQGQQGPQRPRAAQRSGPAPAAAATRTVLIVLVAAALLSAVLGGLQRAGVDLSALPGVPQGALIGQAAVGHAALMIAGFLGTVIGIERAVAVRLRWAFVAPLASGAASVLLLAGRHGAAAACWVISALVFAGVNVVVVRRQAAAHTVLLLVGALAALAGHALYAAGREGGVVLPWWFAFLVLTIAAERQEMTRLMRRHAAAQPALVLLLALLLAGAALSAWQAAAGGVVFGAALAGLALWLGVFDIARRTALAHGLSRYMAVCLLGGYAWLAVAGLAWAGLALGAPLRDLALHALGLGFIVAMVMGHAPVILPAVARVKLLFGPWFYAPLALLHASLLVRFAGTLAGPAWTVAGAALNAAALALFAATVIGSAIAWRVHENAPPATARP